MKTKKADRINQFILQGAQERATAKVRAYLSKNSILIGVKGDDFAKAMDALIKAMMQMYSDAMCDTLDVVDGRDLTEVR